MWERATHKNCSSIEVQENQNSEAKLTADESQQELLQAHQQQKTKETKIQCSAEQDTIDMEKAIILSTVFAFVFTAKF